MTQPAVGLAMVPLLAAGLELAHAALRTSGPLPGFLRAPAGDRGRASRTAGH
jgi:hypothetical protein